MSAAQEIQVSEKGLSYSGNTQTALGLVESLREAYAEAGADMPKMLNDFTFSIESALQRAGVLDEDFTPIEVVK